MLLEAEDLKNRSLHINPLWMVAYKPLRTRCLY